MQMTNGREYASCDPSGDQAGDMPVIPVLVMPEASAFIRAICSCAEKRLVEKAIRVPSGEKAAPESHAASAVSRGTR